MSYGYLAMHVVINIVYAVTTIKDIHGAYKSENTTKCNVLGSSVIWRNWVSPK